MAFMKVTYKKSDTKGHLYCIIDGLNERLELATRKRYESNTKLHKKEEEAYELKEQIEELNSLSQKLKNENEALKKEIQELKNENYKNKEKNERGAGRKVKYNDATIEMIRKLRAEGKSIDSISKEVELSHGTVHRLLKLFECL